MAILPTVLTAVEGCGIYRLLREMQSQLPPWEDRARAYHFPRSEAWLGLSTVVKCCLLLTCSQDMTKWSCDIPTRIQQTVNVVLCH